MTLNKRGGRTGTPQRTTTTHTGSGPPPRQRQQAQGQKGQHQEVAVKVAHIPFPFPPPREKSSRSAAADKHAVQMMRRYAAAVAKGDKRNKERICCSLGMSSSTPSASSSQQWHRLMGQILARPLAAEDEARAAESCISAGESNGAIAGSPPQRITAAALNGGEPSREAGQDINVPVAMRMQCIDAMGVLVYLEKLREDKEEGMINTNTTTTTTASASTVTTTLAAAAATASHGYDYWSQDNHKCNAVFKLLALIEAINSLDSIFRRKLLPRLELVRFKQGDMVFQEEQDESTAWLVLQGRVGITSSRINSAAGNSTMPHHVGELSEGQLMGDLMPETRIATATCLEHSVLLRVDGERYHQVVTDPAAVAAVEQKHFFRSVPLFRGLGDNDLDRLIAVFREVTVPAGEVLCREGHRVDHIYLVKRGRFRILKAFLPKQQQQRQQQQRQQQQDEDTQVEEEARDRQNRRATTLITPPPLVVSHFDVGDLGRKDFVGEGGFIAAAGAGCAGEASHPSLTGDVRAAGHHKVSVVSMGGADVYAAKVADVLPIQSAALHRCWAEGEKHYLTKMREWHPRVLGARIQRQVLWEEQKRAIVLDCVRIDALERKMAVTNNMEQSQGQRWGGGGDGGIVLPVCAVLKH